MMATRACCACIRINACRCTRSRTVALKNEIVLCRTGTGAGLLEEVRREPAAAAPLGCDDPVRSWYHGSQPSASLLQGTNHCGRFVRQVAKRHRFFILIADTWSHSTRCEALCRCAKIQLSQDLRVFPEAHMSCYGIWWPRFVQAQLECCACPPLPRGLLIGLLHPDRLLQVTTSLNTAS